MKKIAITGGIGSGKSIVCNFLREEGYPVFSCDEIYREIAETDEYLSLLKIHFPLAVENGTLNRKKLAQTVFSNAENRNILNAISHPLIMNKLLSKMAALKNTSDLVFAEVPLLLEGQFENLFDDVIVVTREKKKRIEAICARDNLSKEQAQMRIATQFNYDGKNEQNYLEKISAKILANKGDLQALKNSVLTLLKEYRET